MSATKTRTVPALDKALLILELLGDSRSGLTLNELAEQSTMAKSSVHYLAVTLECRGYVIRSDRSGRYLFGAKLISLANSALTVLGLRQQAASHLMALQMRTHLTVHLAVFENHEAIIAARFESYHGARPATWIGKRVDLHCTALGKALLAQLPEARRALIIKERGLPQHNENTISDQRRLSEELRLILNAGYAVDQEEYELGVRCVGAPVFNADGYPIAAVSLSGTTDEITADRLSHLASQVKTTASALNQALRLAVA